MIKIASNFAGRYACIRRRAPRNAALEAAPPESQTDPYPVTATAVVVGPRPEVVRIAVASLEVGQYRLDEDADAMRARLVRQGYEACCRDMLQLARELGAVIGILLLACAGYARWTA